MKNNSPLQLPWIPGHDFAGIVEKTGKNVSSFMKGDKVYGNCQGGSYAEFLAAEPEKTVYMPVHLSYIEAASVPHVAETAWQALYTHGKLQKGQTVLIHGAAGAVGAYAVQFAHLSGANVLATAAANDIQYVKSLGADKVIDYKTQDFTWFFNHVDLVLALVGGDTEERSYSIMKSGGRLVSTVGLSHPEIAKEKGIEAIAMVIQQSGKDLEEITELINDDKVKTSIGVVYPLSEAATAWKVQAGDPSVPHPERGKIILSMED
ncbi:MAG: NADP-dependent oxidoreductase [Bacteroides sp.]|nr:NADP-dependent oxidoreductase [Bacteroides sp.]